MLNNLRIPKTLKIKDPRIAKRMRVINAVKDPFLAMFILLVIVDMQPPQCVQ